MSSSNPIIPPGSPLQPRTAKNSKLVVAVVAILLVHVFILAGLLIQGCKRQDPAGSSSAEIVTNLPAFGTPNSLPNNPPAEETKPPARPAVAQTDSTAPEPAAVTTDHRAATGNPSVTVTDSALNGPATTAKPTHSDMTPAAHIEGPVVMTTYVVKAGDTLTRIAKSNHTTAKAIRSASGLKTDRILVGQKLKVPQGSSAKQTAAPVASESKP